MDSVLNLDLFLLDVNSSLQIKYLRVPDVLLDTVKQEQLRAREAGRSHRGGAGPGGRGKCVITLLSWARSFMLDEQSTDVALFDFYRTRWATDARWYVTFISFYNKWRAPP